IWLAIAFIWTLNGSSYDKSILTFIVGSLMLPLALLLSKVLKTVRAIHCSHWVSGSILLSCCISHS
ncbi:MAG TPA: hypothetical protein PKK88_03535, partial [Bacteroidales bacterium]|nr:hypothetical protein [Bacteroidales bacterium]